MKSILILAALLLAKGVNAGDIWLDSVDGTYNCMFREKALIVSIDSVAKTMTVSTESQKSGTGPMIDQTDALGIMQREVGFHVFNVTIEKETMMFMMYKTSTGKLLMEDIRRLSPQEGYKLPAFEPDMVCEKQ